MRLISAALQPLLGDDLASDYVSRLEAERAAVLHRPALRQGLGGRKADPIFEQADGDETSLGILDGNRGNEARQLREGGTQPPPDLGQVLGPRAHLIASNCGVQAYNSGGTQMRCVTTRPKPAISREWSSVER